MYDLLEDATQHGYLGVFAGAWPAQDSSHRCLRGPQSGHSFGLVTMNAKHSVGH